MEKRSDKNQQMSGKTYLGYQRNNMMQISYGIPRQERQMLKTCKSTVCKKSSKQFCGVFDEVRRSELFDQFWKCSWDEKKTFVINSVVTTST